MRSQNVGFPPRMRSVGHLLFPFVVACFMVAATTAVTAIILRFVEIGQVGDIYLIPVLILALRWGLMPALFAAMISVAAATFFFYPPIYSLHVSDPDQLLDLVLFFFVAVVTSQLVTSLRRHDEIAKMRAKTDQLRDALIGSVSHELRTPLAAILGATSVMLETPAVARDARLLELANVVRDEGERLNNNIQNLLDATRISSEGIHPKLEWIDPTDIVNVAVDSRRRRLSGHRIDVDVPDDLPFAKGDSILIDQALGQILDNAAKYSPIGSAIRVIATCGDDRIVISVIDEGAGLTPGERSRLMQRFYRSERHASTITGSGLGLWIAHAFVAACGGEIEATSDGIARGTQVSIRLAAAKETPQESAREIYG